MFEYSQENNFIKFDCEKDCEDICDELPSGSYLIVSDTIIMVTDMGIFLEYVYNHDINYMVNTQVTKFKLPW